MENPLYTPRRIQKIFAPHLSVEQIEILIKKKNIRPVKKKWGGIERSFYSLADAMAIAPLICPYNLEQIKHLGTKVLTFFTTKGGVLKTTLAFNLSRISALYGLRVLVIGLDLQGDITNTIGNFLEDAETDDKHLKDVLARIDGTFGLYDYFLGKKDLNEIILPSDIPNLSYIPETPELVALNEGIGQINRREYWLKQKVLRRLEGEFDLIVFDCGPHWNKLTTNALVGCDLLVSPVECKINNFRNFQFFGQFLNEFAADMGIDLNVAYIPTKYSLQKRLSREILSWYQNNLPQCLPVGLRENLAAEEAQALKVSLIEHDPDGQGAKELREILFHLYRRLSEATASVHTKDGSTVWPSV